MNEDDLQEEDQMNQEADPRECGAYGINFYCYIRTAELSNAAVVE